ncbi:uncharacterized protein LOC123195944 isoform X2 [Mangifera indica]|uniref:uncharacterized protein LOC123195944 isoform X2 n=1 Tax=Mangifera indica TaxID=29780 RepID=UPI001CF9BFB8|nr:uncharacterized protein LOC123195944 isoform X2 [Mangifera indica]
MVDDFMVCVDRIIASAYFEAAQTLQPQQQQHSQQSDDTVVVVAKEQERNERNGVLVCVSENNNFKNGDEGSSASVSGGLNINNNNNNKKKVGDMIVECRICQEEDQVQAMEAPCACNGTLKFAHRKCIQRWCNKKGDITCEICSQVFSPNYSLPPARTNPDVMAIDIRQAWGPHIDLHDSHLLALAAAEHQFLQSEYEDYAVSSISSIACLRSVVLILLMVWLMRQVLMATRDSGMVQESSSFFNVSLLQFAGFFLPCYVMARSWYIMQSRRRRQGLFGAH